MAIIYGRGQEAVFVTGIYAPLQKLFALRRGFKPKFSIKTIAWYDRGFGTIVLGQDHGETNAGYPQSKSQQIR
jgi:hypothetical protein